jgi:hypothetical protein
MTSEMILAAVALLPFFNTIAASYDLQCYQVLPVWFRLVRLRVSIHLVAVVADRHGRRSSRCLGRGLMSALFFSYFL